MPWNNNFLLVLLIGALCLWPACGSEDLPEPSSPAYREAVTEFYASLAALQASEDLGAEERLTRVTELAPGEPAAWANLGLLALRRGELELARARLAEAHDLAPDHPRILTLLAHLAAAEGRFEDALSYLRQARAEDPGDLKVAYLLLEQVERTRPEGYEADVRALLDDMLDIEPNNLVLRLDRIRVAAQAGDRQTVETDLAYLEGESELWSADAQTYLEQLQQTVAAGDLGGVGANVPFLRNALLPSPGFRRDLQAVRTPPEEVGDLMASFVRLPSPRPEPAPADTGLAFAEAPIPDAGTGTEPPRWNRVAVLWQTDEPSPALAGLTAEGVQVNGQTLARPGSAPGAEAGAPSVAMLDVNYDFVLDVALAGPEGIRLFQQDSAGTFTDVTAAMNLPPGDATAAYTGVWAGDVDLEGDMDLVLGRADDAPLVLRNNGDGTFTPQSFEGVAGLQGLAWADLDGDGDPDVVQRGPSGNVLVYWNERQGQYRAAPDLPLEAPAQAMTVADWDADGRFDVLALDASGAIERVAWDPVARSWTSTRMPASGPETAESPTLIAADFDNNGALDVLIGAPGETHIRLGGAAEGGAAPNITIPAFIQAVADFDADGRLDLAGLRDDGTPAQWRNVGAIDYAWQVLRPRAAQALGEQRINTYGLGGVVEARSGLLYQQYRITEPVVHLGLGEQEQTDVARIIWPNGNIQAEFDLAADQAILASQRLKGSCPWLFTYDGTGMQFVTDLLWRSPLGLRINAQVTAGVVSTEDWIRIRDDQLRARDGHYDLRITAELWETHFFDHVALTAVDHPADLDVFVDERFILHPQAWQLQAMTPPRPVASARDQTGRDVTERLRERDGVYVGPPALGPYHGVAQEHVLELDLGAEARQEPALRLVAYGWTRPTDSSINVALSQGSHAPPQSLSLEVPDEQGGWRTVQADLGFPAGKNKTIVLDLTDVFQPEAPRRLRLRTNLEIYWDAIGWAGARPETALEIQQGLPERADLRYRGFSATSEADRSSPEIPDYQTLAGTAPRWQDLIGFHTRYGDVRPLLEGVDDRYVIMNAGDELRLRFPALPPPAEGRRRTFVFISDGWVKDGDYNTAFSKTVRPLPAHGEPDYTRPPGPLADDPVYRRHASDWATYHTRYVTPDRWRALLVPR